MKKSISLITITSMIFASGCSAFKPSTQMVNISCEPEDSKLIVNGERYGNQAQVKVKRNRDMTIQCQKSGYDLSQRTIGHHFNGTGALDAVGTFFFIFPVIGIFTPGAWSLDQTNIQITLYEK